MIELKLSIYHGTDKKRYRIINRVQLKQNNLIELMMISYLLLSLNRNFFMFVCVCTLLRR